MSQNNAKSRRAGIRLSNILTIVIATILFIYFIIPTIRVYTSGITSEMPDANHLVPLTNGSVLKQEIGRHPGWELSAINLKFNTYDRANRGTLKVALYEDDSAIESWSLSTADLIGDEATAFTLERPVRMNKGATYSFTVTDSYRGRNMVALWVDARGGQGFYIDGAFKPGNALCCSLTCRFTLFSDGVLIVGGYILMLLLIALFFFLYGRRERLCALEATITQKLKSKIHLKSTEVTVWDWIVFAILAGFCYFTMQYTDILHTAPSSFALLRGHIPDFYEYNAATMGGSAYMISTYVLFALWNIPLAMLGLMGAPTIHQPFGVLMWFKALPTTLFVLSGIAFYRICKKYEAESGISAKWGAFLFLLTPTAFYSQFMFGQYDAMTVIFMVLGLKVLLDEKRNHLIWFSCLFGLATTFKYHALLFYFPILLYREKRLPALIKNTFFFVLPIALVNLPYLRSSAFTSGVEGFGALDYFFAASLEYYEGGAWKIYLVPLLWVAIDAYAYTVPTSSDRLEDLHTIAFLTGLVTWLAFGIVFWHPQWIMIATPFLVMGIVASRRRTVMCFLDIALTLVFLSILEYVFRGLTQGLFTPGILGQRLSDRHILSPVTLDQFCLLKDGNVAFTSFSCLLLARAILLRPRQSADNTVCKREVEALWFRIRGFAGICILVVPMIICLLSELNTPRLLWDIGVDETTGKASINVHTEADFNNLVASVWSEENGQDDLRWYRFEHKDGDLWQCTVNLADHNTLGKYYVHLHDSPKGKRKLLTMGHFNVSAIPSNAGGAEASSP